MRDGIRHGRLARMWVAGAIALLAACEGRAQDEALAMLPPMPGPDVPMARCMNMGNALEAPREGAWGPAITRADVRAVAAEGFDTIRLPVRWSAHLDARGGIDPRFLARVDEVVRWALAEDLNVIVNVHHFEALMRDPDAQLPRLHGIWAQLSRHYADWPDSLIFELVNEPSEAFDQRRVNRFNAEALEGIRRSNPERWVILGGANWGTITPFESGAEPGVEVPGGEYLDPRIIATFHSYTPYEFTHQGVFFSDDPPPVGRALDPVADRAAIRAEMTAARQWTERTGVPMFLGEFGAFIRTIPQDQRASWTRIMREEAEAHGVSWCYWDWQTEFAYVDAVSKRPLPGMREALFARDAARGLR